MTFMVYHGLHGAVAEGFASAAEAEARVRGLEQNGAKFIQAVDPEGRDLTLDQLARMAAAEGEKAR